jgi:hypothetical protein
MIVTIFDTLGQRARTMGAEFLIIEVVAKYEKTISATPASGAIVVGDLPL